MLYLDTNAFYYAANLSNGPCCVNKLQKVISEQEVSISSVSFFEFVLRFRNDIEAIHKGGVFLIENNVKIGFSKYYPKPQYMPLDWDIISEQELKLFIEGILENKIDIEGRFSSIFFSVCLVIIADFMVRSENEEGDGVFYINVFKAITNTMSQIDIKVFKAMLSEGYRTDDCENFVRKAFDDYMEFWLQFILPMLEAANEVDTYEEYEMLENESDWDTISECISKKINREITTMKFVQKKAKNYWKKTGDDHLKNFLSNLESAFGNLLKEEALQEYFIDIMGAFLLEGASFWKNDILDAMIMSHLSIEDTLITFDNGAIKHMRKYAPIRETYKRSLELIDELKVVV